MTMSYRHLFVVGITAFTLNTLIVSLSLADSTNDRPSVREYDSKVLDPHTGRSHSSMRLRMVPVDEMGDSSGEFGSFAQFCKQNSESDQELARETN